MRKFIILTLLCSIIIGSVSTVFGEDVTIQDMIEESGYTEDSTEIDSDAADIIVPTINDNIDFSDSRISTYTEENGIIIESSEASAEEIEHGLNVQEPHVSPSLLRHAHPLTHTHKITNVKNSNKSYNWYPSAMWTRNSQYPNSADWPTVSWSTSVSLSLSADYSLSVGVPLSVVSATVGSSYGVSSSIATSTTRTFKVPYGKDGRVVVSYIRPYSTFTCETTYFYGPPTNTSRSETGSGYAYGKAGSTVVDLETRSY